MCNGNGRGGERLYRIRTRVTVYKDEEREGRREEERTSAGFTVKLPSSPVIEKPSGKQHFTRCYIVFFSYYKYGKF